MGEGWEAFAPFATPCLRVCVLWVIKGDSSIDTWENPKGRFDPLFHRERGLNFIHPVPSHLYLNNGIISFEKAKIAQIHARTYMILILLIVKPKMAANGVVSHIPQEVSMKWFLRPMQTDATLLVNNTQHCWAQHLHPFAWNHNNVSTCWH